eukprot:TRINITY_DN42103_c0_g3_i1.p1 TRINITY_DN42103_c0_g3~~TRINITY_DN42103_c0_g3_i1.p1  ORF type:complete len:491 (-),score=90.55 TRINITY_DN42103_c0_g3_i1:319-1791(-)
MQGASQKQMAMTGRAQRTFGRARKTNHESSSTGSTDPWSQLLHTLIGLQPTMGADRDAKLTGITSFDVPDMVKPMVECLEKLQRQIEARRSTLLEEMHLDPVPQISHPEIESATKFLKGAIAAMQGVVGTFSQDALSLQCMDSDSMKALQEKARESSRQLVLLLGENSTPFEGKSMEGEVIEIRKDAQHANVVTRIRSLQSFFDTFGHAKWLGELFEVDTFNKDIQAVLTLLRGLLSPQKASLTCTEERYYDHDHGRFMTRTRPSTVPNPLGEVSGSAQKDGQSDEVRDQLNELTAMCMKLKSILEADEQTRTTMQSDLEAKMEGLAEFANALNEISGVLKTYVLVRLGDLNMEQAELRILKAWVTHDEATGVHRMLEAFRDEVSLARSVHMMRCSMSESSWSLATGPDKSPVKEYLFSMSANHAGSAHLEEVNEDHEESAEDEDCPEGEDGQLTGKAEAKSKLSHRQRQRRGKWKANIPQTPSEWSQHS